jgi:two-component system alkaline phosphatase synthesis response regulator PhoP
MNQNNGKKILLVEDEPDVLQVTKKTLESAGFDVITACDGKEGLEIARKGLPDLIVLDLLLPGMDGYKVCGILKHDIQYMTIPILILSGRSQSKDYELGLKVGANAYLTKPFEPKALIEKIAELIRLSPKKQQRVEDSKQRS